MSVLSDDYYDGMTFEEAWQDYFERHPEVLANWGHQNGYFPNDNIKGEFGDENWD